MGMLTDATAWRLNGAALNAAQWVAASEDPQQAYQKRFRFLRCWNRESTHYLHSQPYSLRGFQTALHTQKLAGI